jgi:hypothetical protein
VTTDVRMVKRLRCMVRGLPFSEGSVSVLL